MKSIHATPPVVSNSKSGLFLAKICKGRILSAFVCGLLSILFSGSLSQGATNNWLSSSGDSYTNKVSWDAGVLPTVLDTATVGNPFQLNGSVLYTNALGDPAGTNAL